MNQTLIHSNLFSTLNAMNFQKWELFLAHPLPDVVFAALRDGSKEKSVAFIAYNLAIFMISQLQNILL